MTCVRLLLLSPMAVLALQGLHSAAPLSARRPSPRCCASPAEPDESNLPQVDMRGFVVPQVGDVVKVPSKWPGEWDVAQVDFVQTVVRAGGGQAVEVDLLPLKSIGDGLYRLPGGRGKPASVRADIGKLGKLKSEYVRENDSYRIDEAQLAPLIGKKAADPNVVEQSLAEYDELKGLLIRDAALVGAAGAAGAFPFLGSDVSIAVGLGTVAGCGYIWLLGAETEGRMGAEQSKAVAVAAGARLLLPAVLMCALAARQAANGAPMAPLASLPPQVFAGGAFGFLTYKVPLLARQVLQALEELTSSDAAEVPLTQMGALPTGSIGMAFRIAQQQKKEREARAESAADKAERRRCSQVVLAGPSGVGKSTLIGRLLADKQFAGRFGFSVSSTTRPPREGEVEGVDYRFVSPEAFEQMAEAGDFLEWARVGEHAYGTSVQAVEQVGAAGQSCVLDLDVQGVQAILKRSELSPYCVWVAPPTFEVLRERLQRRGTEGPEEIESRVARARAEIEFALEAKCFDKIILNDDIDVAYEELKQALLGIVGASRD